MKLSGQLAVTASDSDIKELLLKEFKANPANAALVDLMDLSVEFKISRSPTRVDALIELTPKDQRSKVIQFSEEPNDIAESVTIPEKDAADEEEVPDLTETTEAFDFDA